jgi:hypothetical protein
MKAILIICLLFLSIRAFAPSARSLFIEIPDKIKPFEKLWQAVCKIESNNDSLAFCIDINGKPSVGIAQIQESRLNDYNTHTGNNYKLMDCFSPVISKKIFMYYCQVSYEMCAKRWNGSGKMTEIYWNKIKSVL